MTRICATRVSEAVSAVILVDTCVLLDVLQNDARWADWSQAQLELELPRDVVRIHGYFPTVALLALKP